MKQKIKLGEFAPDLDPTTPGIITDCTNFVPTLKGYKGGAAGSDVGLDALASAAVNAAVLLKLDASNRLFAGTATKIYEKSGSAWTDVSSTTYSASSVQLWRFSQFGNTSLAVNKGDYLQYSNSGAFAAVTGAPKAGAMCTVAGFVMVANTNEATYGNSEDRWWCSGYNDYTDWTPAVATQCTTGRLIDTPGPIRGVRALGSDVVAYKDRSMYYGRYVGTPVVWQWELIPGKIGCQSQDCIVDIGTAHYFIGFEDIYVYDGTRPVPIGTPLREWFFTDLDAGYSFLIRGMHDRANGLVYWFYPRSGSVGVLNGCIVYNYKSNKWGVAHRTIECPIEYIVSGLTWNTIPAATWNAWPTSTWDSPYWVAQTETAAYIGTDHKIYSLTGASASSDFTTGSYGDDSTFTLLSQARLRYLAVPTTGTMVNYYQNEHGDTWTAGATTTESNGRFDVLRSARWHKMKFSFTGDIETSGINLDLIAEGDE